MSRRRHHRVVLLVGTRPEVVKMAPVCFELQRNAALEPLMVSTGQHSELLDTALAAFGLVADEHLHVMQEGQSPNDVAARILERLPPVLDRLNPSAVIVQGDTTSVLAASLSAFHTGIPIGHVEAGLRTFDLTSPFPEEANRQLADRLATWCFAPTKRARQNLLDEGIRESRIHVCGNTSVDSILWMVSRAPESPHKGDLLVTLHRRESFGQPLLGILLGIREFMDEHQEAKALWPVHPNPNVLQAASEVFSDYPRFKRIEPVGYREFAAHLRDCRVILTDSGGIQEEAPSLGKRALIARDATERPEAVEHGLNRLIGRDRSAVRQALSQAWREPPYAGPLPAPNPYGDGRAAKRIVAALDEALAR